MDHSADKGFINKMFTTIPGLGNVMNSADKSRSY